MSAPELPSNLRCRGCNGTGRVIDEHVMGPPVERRCMRCHGEGVAATDVLLVILAELMALSRRVG